MRSHSPPAGPPRIAVTVATVCLACAAPAPEAGSEVPGQAIEGLMPSATDARYITHLLFAAVDGRAFFGSFDQTAQQDLLAREYEAWWTEGETWRALTQTADTLPAARAAWRLLPAGEMSVRIGDAGQVVSLAFAPRPDEEADTVRLRAGEEVSVWTGPTGQRESLGLAVVESGEDAVPGVLFFRRAARALRIAGTGSGTRTFVFADSLGNGLLIHEGTASQPAVAHTWLHGIDTAWGDVVLAAVDSAGGPDWHFEIAGTELSGEIRPIGAASSDLDAALRLEAILSSGEERFRFAGLAALLPLP